MGVPESPLRLVPCGIHTQRFVSSLSRRALRDKHGIGEATFGVIVVTIVRSEHERVGSIIEEVHRLLEDILLWIDRPPKIPAIPARARDRLGSRCRITHVPSSEVGELFHPVHAMVHAVRFEAFGLAIVEALSTGLTVVIHDSPHYYYLTEDPERLVDMAKSGYMAARLQDLMRHGA